MLNKLLKYDLKYMLKNMGVFYILSIVAALIARLFFSLKQTVIISIMAKFSAGFMFAMVGNILFNTIIRSLVIFKNYLYKDEAYLTHTLPVTKTQIYESKFIQTLIFTLVGFIIMFLSIFITYYTKENFDLLKNIINGVATNLNINHWLFILFVIIIFYIEIIHIIQCMYFGVIIGYRKNSNKAVHSFLTIFITYIISQTFIVLAVFASALFNKDILNVFNSTVIDVSVLKPVILISTLAYLLVIFIINMLCNRELKKGVNLE